MERAWKEAIVANLMKYPGIPLEEFSKTMNTSVGIFKFPFEIQSGRIQIPVRSITT
jgi:hypothetical protein